MRALACALFSAALAAPAAAQEMVRNSATNLSAAQMFALADDLEAGGDSPAAEAILAALEQDIHLEIRNEARFRRAALLARHGQIEAAIQLHRDILREQPDAQRVRIELAGLLAQAGKSTEAERELAAAQAAGLPPDVARIVNQYAAALRSSRPYGASFEVAFAPSNNINRATTASTLDTVVAPLELSDDARAKSGIGVRLGGQAYYRHRLSDESQLTFRAAGEGSFYRRSEFDNVVTSLKVGLESRLGQTKVKPFISKGLQWFGGDPYATTDAFSVEFEQPVDQLALLTGGVSIGRAKYRLNNLQDGNIYAANFQSEFAITPDSGIGVGVSLDRQDARDPGYATKSGGLNLLLWSRVGDVSVFGNVGASKLTADARLTLFPERRQDRRYSATIGATAPQFAIMGFAPVFRLAYEQNNSTVGIYNYSRLTGDIGFTQTF